MNSKFIFFSIALLSLAACSQTPLGFGKAGPNEFLITTYPPLTVPKILALRAPSPADKITQSDPKALANRVLFGIPLRDTRRISASEKILLQKIGTDKADPNIRKHIAEDRGLAVFSRPLIKRIISAK